MKKIINIILILLLMIIGCTKESTTKPSPPEPGYYTLTVDNNSWFRCDIYVEGLFVRQVNSYISSNIGDFLQNETSYLKAMYGDSIIVVKYINTLELENYTLTIDSTLFELSVENQKIYYVSFGWFIDYDIYVNGEYAGKWDDVSGSFNQNENTFLVASVDRYSDFNFLIDTRGKENYTWNLKVPMFKLYVECNFDGEGDLLVDDKWNIGVYQSYKTTYIGELPNSDSTHLNACPFSPQYEEMEIIVNTLGLTSYTWVLPSQ
ncbi:hypothetical protein KAX75_04610 [candidate division WOR-3 bacterium]|nr:hypothetical protein [candidate division WOR-3 bacterium]